MGERERITLTITRRLANELRQWAEDEQTWWPEETVYQADLHDLLKQLPRPPSPERRTAAPEGGDGL